MAPEMAGIRSVTLVDQLIGTPEFTQDPYPTYRRLREESPVAWSQRWESWVITRFADVDAMLRDTRRFSNVERFGDMLGRLPGEYTDELSSLREHVSLGMANVDPPDHSRLRALASKAFHARAIDALRPHVKAIVDELLDAVAADGEMDVVRDLAFPLPAIVISEMLGVPPEDRALFKGWVGDTQFHGSQDNAVQALLERARRASAAVVSLTEWLRPQFEERRRRPTDDLLSALVAAEDRGDVLSEAELVTTCIVLVRAGHITTQGLIGNAVLGLLRHPRQLSLLIDHPDLIGSAVEEFLRYDTPFLRDLRRVAVDTEFAGVTMRSGDLVSLMLGAANRDPAQCPEPERLDITRPASQHVAFGVGVHFCLGAPLARLEAEVALSTLLHRWPRLSLGPTSPRYPSDNVLHSLESLTVRLSA